MFRFARSKLNQQQVVHLNVADRVKQRSAPISDQLKQLGIKPSDVEACSNKGGAGICARAASSLLQDWVTLSHRRHVHSSNDDDHPKFNMNTRSWSDEECALINKTMQLREFDPSKVVKMNVASSSTSSGVRPPRTVQRQSSSHSHSQEEQQKSSENTREPIASSFTETVASPSSSTTSPSTGTATKLKPRIVVRQSRRTTSAATTTSSLSSSSDASTNNNDKEGGNNKQDEKVSEADADHQDTTGATPRRRVVRVGGASR